MRVSIIIPFYNEEACAGDVLREVKQACPHAEIIAVDDGSSDGTVQAIEAVDGVRLLCQERNLGQSAALYTGLHAATGEALVMMDGDGQNDPADIPKLVETLQGADVVCGYRANRQDTFSRRLASRIANNIRRAVLQDGLRDTGCSLKAMRKEHLMWLIPFNGLHRFMGAFFAQAGLSVAQIPVNHRPRTAGVSKYTIGGRALRGLYDLFGVRWALRRHILWKKTPYV